MKAFYETYFGAHANQKYCNPAKGFESYFLSFAGGARLELMCRQDIQPKPENVQVTGYAHIAMSVGSRHAVDALTERMKADGVKCLGEPRVTGDGCYESVFADPEGNCVEITV